MVEAAASLETRYELEEMVGAGGMAQVWRAKDRHTGVRVAIKRLFPGIPEIAQNTGFHRRLRREAIALQELRHPSIVGYLDVGVDANGFPYIALEWLQGADLATHLHRRGAALPLDRAARIAKQVLQALGAAHACGIVHRDLKPANVYIVDDDSGARARLIDFGLALLPEQYTRLTKSGVVVGTPHYMAPEQLRGNCPVDHRCDVYAAGALLYEMVTGQQPFSGTDLMAVILSVLSDTPVFPRELRPNLPEALEDVILVAMRRASGERYESAAAMLDALCAATNS